ncbi:NAD(P)-dependent oxidoreductase [Micromonospora krabiensis]|uniref:3-hydroxyisobutyrate dehydrogenase n=1 Tax=Micromonospora krabiensis TaxID=307121 RepID=A0A1C3MWP4_9ACTN|nr:NAD(P)-dependent oxidoreductase [Micromonospora krabiensis]SBV24752.1 3-hydroxyisobutyrate dehydrogenase [Micromonospora krabiensis]
MTEIAVLGTGQMGAAIARRLLATGHHTTVWNRTPARAAALADAGATVATTPTQAVATADLVITMLTDAAAVEATLFGTGDDTAPVAALRPGAIVVQMSTIGPDQVRAVAARLPEFVTLLDAPVGGSVDAVDAGALTILVGGPASVVERAAPVLRALGSVRLCGRVGDGSALKLVTNTALVTAFGALHDTLAVADAQGVDRAVALDALSTGALGGVVARARRSGASFAISLAGKDADLAHHVAPTTTVLAAATHLLHHAADQRADVATLINLENR